MNKTKLAFIGATLAIGGYLWAAPQFGATTEAKIAAAQDAYFTKHGQYLQVKEGNQLPEYESKNGEKVKDKLRIDVPVDYRVDVQNGGDVKKYIITKIPPPYVDMGTSTTKI